MISCCLIYAAMAGGHVFLCSVFFSLFGSYIMSWKVKRHLFLSSHGPSISGHEIAYFTEFQTTFLLPLSSSKGYGAILLSARLVSSRVSYYPNSGSSFHQLRLVLNPGATALSSSYTMSNSKLNCALLNSRSFCNKIVDFQGLVYGNNLDQLRNETSTILNKFNAGLQESFLEGIILSMSAFSQ